MKSKFIVTMAIIFMAFVAKADDLDTEKDKVKAAVSVHNGESKSCYNEALAKDKTLEGKIVFDLEINDQGQATKVTINSKKTQIKNDKLSSCLIDKMKSWSYPAAAKGTTLLVTYPYMFKKNSN